MTAFLLHFLRLRNYGHSTQALTFTRVAEQQGEADSSAHKARKTKQDEEEDNLGQRVILVTEPHTDINAGLVIILDSDHDSPLDLADAAEAAGQLPSPGQDELGQPCCRDVWEDKHQVHLFISRAHMP